MRKYALVLSGGGFKGAFQVGALKYLQNNWDKIDPDGNEMKFDIITGVSVGALNGYLVAANQFDELENIWKNIALNGVSEIYTSDFIDTDSPSDKLQLKIDAKKLIKKLLPNLQIKLSLWAGLGILISKSKKQQFIDDLLSKAEDDLRSNLKNFKAIADYTPLKEKLKKLVKTSAIEENCTFKSGFVSLNDGQYYSIRQDEFDSDEDFQNAILASAAMPIIWEPVPQIKSRKHQLKNSIDGGLRNVSPLGDVIDEINADETDADYTIIIINCNNGTVEKKEFDEANIAQIALRALTDISLSEIFNNDLREFLRINNIIEQTKTACPNLKLLNYDFQKQSSSKAVLKSFNAILIQPDTDSLGDTLVANKKLHTVRLDQGKKMAKLALEQLPLLV